MLPPWLHATGVAGLISLAACRGLPHDAPAVTPQRPTLSSDTNTAAEGTLELEAGGTLFDGGGRAVPLVLRLGASARSELFLGWAPHVRVDAPGSGESGIGDVTVGLRHRLRDGEGSDPSLAVQGVVKLPTADEGDGLGSGEPDLLLAAIASASYGSWSTTAFAELDLLGDPRGGVLVGESLAIAASRPLGERLGLFGELAGVFVPELDADQVFTTIGLTYARRPSQVFDVAVAVGLDEDAPDFALLFGVTQNLGQLVGRRGP